MGRLRARGTLLLKQFWPEGKSDADTANLSIALDLSPAFVFRPESGVEQPTKVFDEAYWKDRSKLKPLLGAKHDKLRVRLQGIDAPELHFLPPVKGAKNFRQRLAESAVFALREKLLQMADGRKELRADAITFVESPNDAFDMFGRFVGNVTVYADGFALDINHWLLEQGWAVPGLYNSMTTRELNVARSLSSQAAKRKLGFYKAAWYKNKLVKFEHDLVVRHKVDPASFRLYEDRGSVMNPKFFRRQANFEAREKNKSTGKTFRQSLAEDKGYRGLTWAVYSSLPVAKRGDLEVLREASVPLGSLISVKGSLPKAENLIYLEGPADIVDAQGNVIDGWDF